MNEPRVPLLIRIPASLKQKIGELARLEHRSTNQQIEFLLDRALADIASDHSRKTSKKLQAKEGTKSSENKAM